MKTEQLKKVLIVSSMILIGVVICVSTWFFLSGYKAMDRQEQSQQSVPKISKDANNEAAKIAPLTREPVTRREKVARQSRKMFKSRLSEEQLANPHFQKMLEVMDSPEFAELPSFPSIHEWKDLLESKGVPVTRGNPGVFTKHPPFMSLDDYEPIIRQRLAELFLTAEPVDMTDPKAAIAHRLEIFSKLNKAVPEGQAWFMERFGDDWVEIIRPHEGMENNPAVIWVTDIQQNAERIVAAAATVRTDALKASAPSWDMSSVAESSKASDSETEMPTPLDTKAHPPMTDAEIEAAIEKSLTLQTREALPNERPDTPGGIQSNIEASLKAQFSSERFDRAMDTLDKYGPQEGLRRLREHDPEVAKQVEKARHHNRQEDAQ